MSRDDGWLRYRRGYATLLRLYPKPFRERFAEPMEQTFCDICRARASSGRGSSGLALWLWVEAVGGIVKEYGEFRMVRSVLRSALIALACLLIPVWGNAYVDGWNWNWRGFVMAGLFVFTAALLYQLAVKRASDAAYRIGMGLAVATAFALVWANLVMAADDAGSLANLAYLGVAVVAFAGAAVARLRARGMTLAMAGAAMAQLLVPFVALGLWNASVSKGEAVPIIGLNGAAGVLFAASAALFLYASRSPQAPHPD